LEKQKLIIGRIPYANLFPIFYMLEKTCDCASYEFVEGVPSELNKKIREGLIDISPSSSIEYLRNSDKYDLIENHSISSKGPVGSILLFSRRTIETLNGLTVFTSSQSETSTALLKIILEKFYQIECRLKSTGEPLEKAIDSHAAYLSIGDEALVEALKWPELYIYDLGELWWKNTGLPFSFALWLVRKDFCSEKKELFERFRKNLDNAKLGSLKDLKAIASALSLRNVLSEDELIAYWKGISYDFDEEHKKGLELFKKYAIETRALDL
jgi:chorismate dehydratase